MEEERRKNIIIWGLEGQLNVKGAVQTVLDMCQSKVEVVKFNPVETKEGRLLVFVQLKEETMVQEILGQKFRLSGSGVSRGEKEMERKQAIIFPTMAKPTSPSSSSEGE